MIITRLVIGARIQCSRGFLELDTIEMSICIYQIFRKSYIRESQGINIKSGIFSRHSVEGEISYLCGDRTPRKNPVDNTLEAVYGDTSNSHPGTAYSFHPIG